ncbi:aldo/keto reductase [Streptomyces sp. NBC_00083]|uniref:aldo/keto reductase n=1 Tax=Streptomyces sp. NBC_00083 TaxID=2975647 RepID=UPI002257A5EB|nr:aldo/keto reductase [Streptomyces sp. NBC_00083]MCX5382410.1 aldo/keto reductase [Streptomyces sp. NBC_00083]
MNAETITAAAAGSWKLGDLDVNRIGFGTMRLPQRGAALRADAEPRDRDEAIAVLRKAVELGVNHLDTAAFYFSPLRSANELINSALAPYADDLVITTKVGPARLPSGEWGEHARTPEALRGQVEENLRQLGRDHLDVVNLRISPGADSVAERFGALAELREAGLIRHLGLSNVRPAHLDEALAIAPVVCVQNPYGVGASEEQEEMLRLCGERGIAFVPFYAIAGAGREAGAGADTGTSAGAGTGAGTGTGGAAGAESAENAAGDEVAAVARERGVSVAQVRLAWTLHRGPHVLAIPGTGDPAHLVDNVAAGALRLTDAEMARLSATPPGASA